MGHQSIVYGYILEVGDNHESNISSITNFEFDEVYPFTNIFWSDTPIVYGDYVIGFTGATKQLEDDWNEWMWKFSRLLSTLEASRAVVHLDGYLGSFSWNLQPLSWHLFLSKSSTHLKLPNSFRGEEWGISEAPPDDFSLDSTICKPPRNGLYVTRWPRR